MCAVRLYQAEVPRFNLLDDSFLHDGLDSRILSHLEELRGSHTAFFGTDQALDVQQEGLEVPEQLYYDFCILTIGKKRPLRKPKPSRSRERAVMSLNEYDAHNVDEFLELGDYASIESREVHHAQIDIRTLPCDPSKAITYHTQAKMLRKRRFPSIELVYDLFENQEEVQPATGQILEGSVAQGYIKGAVRDVCAFLKEIGEMGVAYDSMLRVRRAFFE